MFIVDAHLDLSMNALSGRDIRRSAVKQPMAGKLIATVGLPDLRAGDVKLVCATVFTEPSIDGKPGYRNADEAYAQGQSHLAFYQREEAAGTFRFIRWREEIQQLAQTPGLRHSEDPDRSPSDPALQSTSETGVGGSSQRAILLMEGADPLRTPADLQPWFDAGLRIVGLAWKRTRFAGGTGDPGPLTDEGRALIPELDRLGIIHDASHLAEQSFWDLLSISSGPVIASHSNCRSIVPTDRQLSDEMINAIIARGGVIGINFFDRFLLAPEDGKRRATLTDVVRHMKHICDLAGNANHVGIGTDMDGGLGRNEIPLEIQTSADLPKLAEVLTSSGFTEADTANIMGDNWLQFFAARLPSRAP